MADPLLPQIIAESEVKLNAQGRMYYENLRASEGVTQDYTRGLDGSPQALPWGTGKALDSTLAQPHGFDGDNNARSVHMLASIPTRIDKLLGDHMSRAVIDLRLAEGSAPGLQPEPTEAEVEALLWTPPISESPEEDQDDGA